MAKLRPRARIIRTIGDQLISGPEAAVIELVKNAYDADSPFVRIRIEPPGTLAGVPVDGLIEVSDKGHGMSSDDILGKWFEPATTDKVIHNTSPGNRRMLGAKGIGRFAAARLGHLLRLSTCARMGQGQMQECEVVFDWDEFDKRAYLDEIDIPVRSATLKKDGNTGTRLSITRLRDTWTKDQLLALVKELRRIASPMEAQERNFRIFLDLRKFTETGNGFDGQTLVAGVIGKCRGRNQNTDLQDPLEIFPYNLTEIYHYKVNGEFLDDGSFSGLFVNHRSGGNTQEIRIGPKALPAGGMPCGRVRVQLHIYDREIPAIDELLENLGLDATGRADARRILDENIGVGIYRNGFRIRPYGDAETDWLELESKRVQRPAGKLGLNQVWGIVEIGDEQVSHLIERSSREGLEHNAAFDRLKDLLADLIAYVGQLRVDFRERSGYSRSSGKGTDEIRTLASMPRLTKAISSLPADHQKKIRNALEADQVELKTAIENLGTYQQVLASRSTLGLVMNQVLHDGRRYLGDITTRSHTMAEGASRLDEPSQFGRHYRASFANNALSIHDSAGHLNSLFKALDPLAGRKRGKPADFDVMGVIEQCRNLFHDLIRSNEIKVEIKAVPGDAPAVHGYKADLMAALLNIFDNAIHWLAASIVPQRHILVEVSASPKYVRILVSNNGPVIPDQFKDSLFKPGFTLKPEGSGIGLTIAREAVRQSRGDVAFVDDAPETAFAIEMHRAVGG